MSGNAAAEMIRLQEWTALYRKKNRDADRWAVGYGPVQHTIQTQARVFAMVDYLQAKGVTGDGVGFFEALIAADRIACAGMWLVVHETYAKDIFLDGRDLSPENFKKDPQGHTGGALNMVPAYTGYMAVNALTGITRSWIMGQGHTVAAVDSVNLLLDNMTEAHAARYSLSDEGMTRYVRDFYSYRMNDQGKQDSPLGSHVNAHTAGGLAEGGYLGFTELQYVHMPLPGERLVVFLSDGAFEEQRGSDWAPRWWRAEDSGYVTPFMINNGRRIDQRTTLSQAGHTDWFARHLELNSFDPIVLDGRDPAAFVWAVFEMEKRLEAASQALRAGASEYPVRLPYGIAVAPKGAGFYGEGTNLAHNLPLPGDPRTDSESLRLFNEHARRLWVPPNQLEDAAEKLKQHGSSRRPRERDHPLATRDVRLREVPKPDFRPVPDDPGDASAWKRTSPMFAVDRTFLAVGRANPHLRPRVGNPDEMRSNRLQGTLDALKFRVTAPEANMPEDVHGAVITALNEEAVASAALGNKGGINLFHTYEAFGTKMHGVVRQEIIFAEEQTLAAKPPGWLSVPLILTSHTWENSKNERSHQDPSMAEAMLGEPSDFSRVMFVPDYNTAAAVMIAVYQTHGQIWSIVAPKGFVPDLFTSEEAEMLLREGAMRLDWAGHRREEPRLVLTAIGAYQLEEALKASHRLARTDVPHSVVYMLEPGRFRKPRSEGEASMATPSGMRDVLYPAGAAIRIFVTHTRPEVMLGVLQPLNTGEQTAALGFINHGGTLSVEGLMYVNRCSWGHILMQAADLLQMSREDLLAGEEIAALEGRRSPEGAIVGDGSYALASPLSAAEGRATD